MAFSFCDIQHKKKNYCIGDQSTVIWITTDLNDSEIISTSFFGGKGVGEEENRRGHRAVLSDKFLKLIRRHEQYSTIAQFLPARTV